MSNTERPLSPHLQIYRPQITSVMSITHRATGVGLSVGLILLAWWLIAAASGPSAWENVQAFSGSFIGRLLLFGWSFALFYHLCNGIRYLFWTTGRGFELQTVAVTGWLVIAAAVALTLLTWILAYVKLGVL